MKLKELIEKAAADTGKPKTEVKAVFDALVKNILEATAKKEETELGSIGKIKIAHRAAGKGRNVATGAEIDVPAKDVPKFSFGKAMKDAANS